MQPGLNAFNRWMGVRLSRLWLWPALAASLSLLTLGVLLWYAHQHDLREHAEDFDSDVDSAVRSVTSRVRGTMEYLHLLAAELAQVGLHDQSARQQVSAFVRENPELEQVGLMDDRFQTVWTEPGQPLWNTWTTFASPEAPDLLQRAKDTRRYVHTGLFEPRIGLAAVELYVPVFRAGSFLGVIAATHSCDGVLSHAVPRHVFNNNRVSLVNDGGRAVCSRHDGTGIDGSLAREVALSSFGQRVSLRVERHATHVFESEMWLLILLCVALTLAMAYGMAALARYAAAHQRAQVVLRRERDNLVNVFEAMEDGVAIVGTDLDVQYVNPTLVKDFGPYEGRKCYEYFHGHDRPCSWCMMDDVIAGKAVHTEWCYPRNEKTYDLIDTRINNPDGTVSKLKMFRDITTRVEAEHALRQSEQRFHHLFERAADAVLLYDADRRIVEANQAACDSLGYARDTLQGLSFDDIYDDGNVAAFHDLLVTTRLANPTTLLARHKRSDGTTFPVEVRLGWLEYHRERLLLASARDITERERAEQAIQKRLEAEQAAVEQAQARLAESESLHRVTTALLEGITLEQVLHVVCGEAQRLTRATGSGVLLLEDGHFRVTHCVGHPPPKTARIDAAGSFGGLAVQRRQPIFIPDLAKHDLRCYRDPSPASLIVVPLRAWGRIIGVLDVAGELAAFEPSDTRILSHLGDQAAVAIEKARLGEQAEQVAVLEERQRLARELHDSVTQNLFGASLYADTAAMVSAAGQRDVATRHMGIVKGLVREALLHMRLLIYELRPPVLEQSGLVGAIEARLAAVEERAGVHTAVVLDGDEVPLPPGVEEALYGFTHEALNNALKHAKARSIRVHVQFAPASVVVEVVDDGVGFDEARAVQSGGIGLKNMRERLQRLGGRLSIRSAPQNGTSLAAEVATRGLFT